MRHLHQARLLISEYHVYMPVYMFEENPTKALIWEWQDSKEKACYMHFHKWLAEYIEGRNPRYFGVARKQRNSKYHERFQNTPQIVLEQADLVVPDEY